MPALKVIGLCGTGRKLTTRPFAGDDLHVLCVLAATYRVIQMACIIPFWVRLFLYRLRGTFVRAYIIICPSCSRQCYLYAFQLCRSRYVFSRLLHVCVSLVRRTGRSPFVVRGRVSQRK